MIMAQTLADVLTALSKRPDIPADARALIAAAARHTEHVSGCTECEAWTESPDAKGRCDQCAIACGKCAKPLDEDEVQFDGHGEVWCGCLPERGDEFDVIPVAHAREVRTP